MTDSLPARVAQLWDTLNGEFRGRLDRLEQTVVSVAAHREQERRFQAACAAMAGVFANPEVDTYKDREYVIREAVRGADALLAALASSSTAPAPQPPEPEPVENSAAPTIDLESVVSDIFLLVEPVSSDDHSDAEMARVLEQVRALVDKTLGPQPPPADGLVDALRKIANSVFSEMEDCGHQVIAEEMDIYAAAAIAEAALTAYEQERERAKEQGRG